jgi:hypothetical protein
MGLFILRRNRWRAFILLGELVVCVTLACLDEYLGDTHKRFLLKENDVKLPAPLALAAGRYGDNLKGRNIYCGCIMQWILHSVPKK